MNPHEIEFLKMSKKVNMDYLLDMINPTYDNIWMTDLYPPNIITSKPYRMLLKCLQIAHIKEDVYYIANIGNYWNEYTRVYKKQQEENGKCN
jgi:hypothetical protein